MRDHGATQSLEPNRKGALMSPRESGYQRKLLDQYETPAWVTQALIPHLPEFTGKVWEPACGSGKMVAALRQSGFDVVGSDITWLGGRRVANGRRLAPMWRPSGRLVVLNHPHAVSQ